MTAVLHTADLLRQKIAKHWWFSGRILACHAGGPGSIPGQCSVIFFYCNGFILLIYYSLAGYKFLTEAQYRTL